VPGSRKAAQGDEAVCVRSRNRCKETTNCAAMRVEPRSHRFSHDIEEALSLFVLQGHRSPIVQHEKLACDKGMQEFAIASVGLGDRKVLVCPDGTRTQNVAALAAGLRVQETCEKSEQRLGRLPRGAYGSALRNHGSSCLQACVDAKLSSLTSLFS